MLINRNKKLIKYILHHSCLEQSIGLHYPLFQTISQAGLNKLKLYYFMMYCINTLLKHEQYTVSRRSVQKPKRQRKTAKDGESRRKTTKHGELRIHVL